MLKSENKIIIRVPLWGYLFFILVFTPMTYDWLYNWQIPVGRPYDLFKYKVAGIVAIYGVPVLFLGIFLQKTIISRLGVTIFYGVITSSNKLIGYKNKHDNWNWGHLQFFNENIKVGCINICNSLNIYRGTKSKKTKVLSLNLAMGSKKSVLASAKFIQELGKDKLSKENLHELEVFIKKVEK